MLGWLVVRNKPGDYSNADGKYTPVNTEQMKRIPIRKEKRWASLPKKKEPESDGIRRE
jgi:hypothetical protein